MKKRITGSLCIYFLLFAGLFTTPIETLFPLGEKEQDQHVSSPQSTSQSASQSTSQKGEESMNRDSSLAQMQSAGKRLTSGITITPETFLRGYDPITIIYDRALSPQRTSINTKERPLDDPSKILDIIPAHPGEYRFLDNRTVQFLPAEPWPALTSLAIRIGNGEKILAETSLTTLMVPPRQLTPRPGENMGPLEKIQLTFTEPIPEEKLADMIRFEIRPLPGVSDKETSQLSKDDFSIKTLERTSANAPTLYNIDLHTPISYGKRILLHVDLSLDSSVPGSVATYSYTTKTPFTIKGMGSGSVFFPVASNGSIYTEEQAINCGTANAPLFIEFSEEIKYPSIETIKELARFEPSVRNLITWSEGNRLYLSFSTQREKPYKISLHDAVVESSTGRPLDFPGDSSFYFYYTQLSPYLKWQQSHAIVERFGPQFFPMEGRAMEKVDMRIYKIDPLSRNFWPFPGYPVDISERERPPMPGEEPEYGTQLAKQLRLLGSPPVSRIITLPITKESSTSTFGLDLKPLLARISGKDAPGTYLVGYRLLDGSDKRFFVRLTSTDLSLSTIEEEHAVNFLVSSLKTGEPVEGAAVTLEAEIDHRLQPVISGTTDSTGQFYYTHKKAIDQPIKRIVVSNGSDVLVLDPSDPPPHFQNNHWYGSSSSWLNWLQNEPRREIEKPRLRGYITTERPIYRPDEDVHLLGYIRQRKQGNIEQYTGAKNQQVVITGPGRHEWTFPVSLSSRDHFYINFNEQDIPTGYYTVRLLDTNSHTILAETQFQKEAYRIPRFEIQISGPDKVPLDREFSLLLTADYYAGGRVVGQEVYWEISQYPLQVRPPQFPGYIFSSDEQFTQDRRFRARGISYQQDITDGDGSATLLINPAIEEDGLPRRYVVEATVRGADAQTVTTIKEVIALPAFMIGLNVENFIKEGKTIQPKIVVIGHDEQPLSQKEITVRLYQRQWHSYLVESDITTGAARYVSDVVDVLLEERNLLTKTDPLHPRFSVEEPGVYIVEVLGRDHLGRLQRVQKDLYVGGEGDVAWKKTDGNVFETELDKKSYAPGDTASLLLKSPFQEGRALVIIEGPYGNDYSWVPISGGKGMLTLPIREEMTPQVPVHTLLMRGRLESTGERYRGGSDRGKPTATANTTWISVRPVAHEAEIVLEHTEKTLPGSTVDVTITMSDVQGNPLDGEAALWLVDRAVLSLARERFANPLNSFIDPVSSHLRIRETRNEVVGNLPVEEMPGGGGEEEMARMAAEEPGLMERVTVRKLFKTVPYFNDSIEVKNGKATVSISMPENLTEFAVRAIGISGYDKFGTAKSNLAVRLPVIVQSALPRFVRPGDSFLGGGIGRIVEGDGGEGSIAVESEGMFIGEPGTDTYSRNIYWEPDRPERIYIPFGVPRGFSPEKTMVTVRMAVERKKDGVSDGFEMKLPVRYDTEKRITDRFVQLEQQSPVNLPLPEEVIRENTLKQKILITTKPELLKLVTALQFLSTYEYGCTEQQVSRLYPAIALQDFLKTFNLSSWYTPDTEQFASLFSYLDSALTAEGLYSYWPGSDGYVSLTSYIVEFLSRARAAGIEFDEKLINTPKQALIEALRSDYGRFVPGYKLRERIEALAALNTVGHYDPGYAQDLLAGAFQSGLYTKSKIVSLLLEKEAGSQSGVQDLLEEIKDSLVFKLRDGEEVFAGIDYVPEAYGGLVLTGNIKTISSATKTLAMADQSDRRVELLINYLLEQADTNGWGNTQENVQALLALKETTMLTPETGETYRFNLTSGEKIREILLENKALTSIEISPTQSTQSGTEVNKLTYIDGPEETGPDGSGPDRTETASPYVWLVTEYIPNIPGDKITPLHEGFAVEREHHLYSSNGVLRERIPITAGGTITFEMEDIVEEHVTVINPEDRNFVAISVPIASGFEPMNPELATSPPEASPRGRITLQPSYTTYEDDKVQFFYNTLPKGQYEFYFRVRAGFEGSFVQPPARSQMMYDLRIKGRSGGTRIHIEPKR